MVERTLFFVVFVCVVACDVPDPEPEELTCDLLEDESNCWAQAAADMRGCLPAGETEAILAADRASCAFADGTRIVFDESLPLDSFDLEHLAFTIQKNGTTCASFEDTFANRMELSAGGATVVSQLRSSFELDCGGGEVYETEFETLFDCAPGAAPTDGFSVEAELVTFLISAVSTPGEMFRCVPEVP